jgi:hypothetical protein
MKHPMALALLLVLTGCEAPDIGGDQVIPTLTADPVELVANGVAQSEVVVCTVQEGHKLGLNAKLTVAGASWLRSSDTSFERLLDPDGCTRAELVAPRTLGRVHVWAEIEGFEKEIEIGLRPAVVEDLLPRTSGQLTPGTTSQIQLTVSTVVDTGFPSAGTRISFVANPVPSGSAYLTNEEVILDATMNSATTTIIAGGSLESLIVDMTATPPGAASPTAMRSLSIPLLP